MKVAFSRGRWDEKVCLNYLFIYQRCIHHNFMFLIEITFYLIGRHFKFQHHFEFYEMTTLENVFYTISEQ